MSKFTMAIADDEMNGEHQRITIYKELFEKNFEVVKYASEYGEILTLVDLNVHVYLLDLYYFGEDYELTIFQIIDSIREKKDTPIMLVSSRWTDESGENISILNKLLKYENIIYVFGWNEIKGWDEEDLSSIKSKNTPFINRIKFELDKFYKRTSIRLLDNETIRILQISDLQFGKDSDPYSSFIDYNIPKYLKDTRRLPHLVILTGDVVEKGLKSEFDKAKIWLNSFSEKLWGSECSLSERVIIVPGNHDCDLNHFLGNEYEYEWSNEKIVGSKKRAEQIKDYNDYSFINFASFMEELTDDHSYMKKYNNLFFVNEKFMNWGIRLYLLNTVENITPNELKNIKIDQIKYNYLLRQTSNTNLENKIFNIMIGHNSPSSLGFERDDNKLQNEWMKMTSFIETAGINLYLYGHEHQCRYGVLNDQNSGSNYAKHMLYSLASTPRLGAVNRPNSTFRGFSLIELERNEGIVSNVKILPFIFNGSKIDLKDSNSSAYNTIIYDEEQ